VNPITSFFAAPSQSSVPERSLSLRTPTACQATTSAPDLEPGQQHCQTTEEMEPRFRIPSNSEEMAGFLSANNEASGSFKPCGLLEPASCRNLFPSDADPDVDVDCTPTFGCIGSRVPQKNCLPTLESDGGNACTRSGESSANPCEDLKPTLIQCSPVEDPISEAETCDKSEFTFTTDVRVEMEKEADEKATLVVQPRLGFSPSTVHRLQVVD